MIYEYFNAVEGKINPSKSGLFTPPLPKYMGSLPDYYISSRIAFSHGWEPKEGNLSEVCPGKMIYGGVFENRKGQLPMAPDRIWYEADINYKSGYRDSKRILWSNDGLIFVTYDHYRTYCEII